MASDKPQFHERPVITGETRVVYSSASFLIDGGDGHGPTSFDWRPFNIANLVYDPAKTYEFRGDNCLSVQEPWPSSIWHTRCAVLHDSHVWRWYGSDATSTPTWSQTGTFDESEWTYHHAGSSNGMLHFPGDSTYSFGGELANVSHMMADYKPNAWVPGLNITGYQQSDEPNPGVFGPQSLQSIERAGELFGGVAGTPTEGVPEWDSNKAASDGYEPSALVRRKFTSMVNGNKIDQEYVFYLHEPSNQAQEPGGYTETAEDKLWCGAFWGCGTIPEGFKVSNTAWRLLVHLPMPPYIPYAYGWKGGPSIESIRCPVGSCFEYPTNQPGDAYDHFPTPGLSRDYEVRQGRHVRSPELDPLSMSAVEYKIVHDGKFYKSKDGEDVLPHSPSEFRSADWDLIDPNHDSAQNQGPVINDKCCPECWARRSGCGCCDEPSPDNFDSDGDGVDDVCVEKRTNYGTADTILDGWDNVEGMGGYYIPGGYTNTCCPDLGPEEAVITISGIGDNTNSGVDYQKCTGGCGALNGSYILTGEDKVSSCKWVLDVTESLGLSGTGCAGSAVDETYKFCDLEDGDNFHVDWDGYPTNMNGLFTDSSHTNFLYPTLTWDGACFNNTDSAIDCSSALVYSSFLGTMSDHPNDCQPVYGDPTEGYRSRHDWDTDGLYAHYESLGGVGLLRGIREDGKFGHTHSTNSGISWGVDYPAKHIFDNYILLTPPSTETKTVLPDAVAWADNDRHFYDPLTDSVVSVHRKVGIANALITGAPSYDGPYNYYDNNKIVRHEGILYRSLDNNWASNNRPEYSDTHAYQGGTHTITVPEDGWNYPEPGTFNGGGASADWGKLAPLEAHIEKATLTVQISPIIASGNLLGADETQPDGTRLWRCFVDLEVVFDASVNGSLDTANTLTLSGWLPLSGDRSREVIFWEGTNAEHHMPVTDSENSPCPWPMEAETDMSQPVWRRDATGHWELEDNWYQNAIVSLGGYVYGNAFSQMCNWSQGGWTTDESKDGNGFSLYETAHYAAGSIGYWDAEMHTGIFDHSRGTCADEYMPPWIPERSYVVNDLVTKDKILYKATTAGSSSTFIPANWTQVWDTPCYEVPGHENIKLKVEVS